MLSYVGQCMPAQNTLRDKPSTTSCIQIGSSWRYRRAEPSSGQRAGLRAEPRAGPRAGPLGTHPSENGTERLQEDRVFFSCIHTQLFCQAGQQRVVICGTDAVQLTHTRQGHLAPQLLALPVQLPQLAIIQTPQVQQISDLRLCVLQSWL